MSLFSQLIGNEVKAGAGKNKAVNVSIFSLCLGKGTIKRVTKADHTTQGLLQTAVFLSNNIKL